jgi:hypothetical protein
MKGKKFIYRICFITIISLALAGALFLSVVAHELIHKQDFEKYVTENGEMCFFTYPANATLKEIIFSSYNIGYYTYTFQENVTEDVKAKVKNYSEIKASLISLILPIILVICLIVEILKRVRNSDAEEFNEFFEDYMRKMLRETFK